MRAYKLLSSKWALDNLRRRRLKISRIHDLNDPFELLPFDLTNSGNRSAVMETKKQLDEQQGLISFSRRWSNPVLWSHYADHHRGIALGFDIPEDIILEVIYVTHRLNAARWLETPSEATAQMMFCTKFAHWSYEDEVRLFCRLEEEDEGKYFASFSDELLLRSVIVGCDCLISNDALADALGSLIENVEIIHARPAWKTFRMTRQKKRPQN